jgi:hypothetical protein
MILLTLQGFAKRSKRAMQSAKWHVLAQDASSIRTLAQG